MSSWWTLAVTDFCPSHTFPLLFLTESQFIQDNRIYLILVVYVLDLDEEMKGKFAKEGQSSK